MRDTIKNLFGAYETMVGEPSASSEEAIDGECTAALLRNRLRRSWKFDQCLVPLEKWNAFTLKNKIVGH